MGSMVRRRQSASRRGQLVVGTGVGEGDKARGGGCGWVQYECLLGDEKIIKVEN